MSDISHSSKLRELSKDYYQLHISVEEYRAKRKIILDDIDREMNGRKVESNMELRSQNDDSPDFMKTIAFFKNEDID